MAEHTLPNASINKILKKILPEGNKVAKDAKDSINRASVVFLLYITTIANEISLENKGKKKKAQIMPEHIIQALEEMEFRNIAQAVKGMSPAPIKRKA
ncbi:unnamed protein product [Blepharisma stoltei]|uniref:Transcription factor CBF/NF-Y/archaeal histone domain-containing protein n=1 Tax=Blepharisma stoltei TaxID=1481888 RepID=A0AAU9I9P7_9CILI|nr:unnamed protein product [Blepharisma stoltei]